MPQEQFDQIVKEKFSSVPGSLQAGGKIWLDLLEEARGLARLNICNVYAPNRKQFIRCVREVRKQAASHRNEPISEVKYELIFKNKVLKVE